MWWPSAVHNTEVVEVRSLAAQDQEMDKPAKFTELWEERVRGLPNGPHLLTHYFVQCLENLSSLLRCQYKQQDYNDVL